MIELQRSLRAAKKTIREVRVIVKAATAALNECLDNHQGVEQDHGPCLCGAQTARSLLEGRG